MDIKFYVSLEAARLLKEKGYDRECVAYYQHERFHLYSVDLFKLSINNKNAAPPYMEQYSAPSKAEAEIAIAKAEGEAKAMRIKADAEAYYNMKISSSLTHNIVLEDWIEKWDGKLPQMQGNSNMVPMVNFNK